MTRLIIYILIVFAQYTAFSQSIDGFTGYDVNADGDFSLSDYKNSKGVIVVFYSNKCAYGEYYFDRIMSLEESYRSNGIQFILINSNSGEFVTEESEEGMRKFLEHSKINIPYIADKDKQIKTLLNATRTPEVIVLKPLMGRFIIYYQGAIDDNPQSASDVGHEYLKEAIVSLLNNDKSTWNKTRPVGCLIK